LLSYFNLFLLFLFFVVFALLLLLFPLFLKDLIDTVLQRRWPIVDFEVVPGLHDGILEFNSEFVLSHLLGVISKVKVVENIVDCNLLLHQ